MALLIKLPTVLPLLLSYHSWIISPSLRSSCVIVLRLPAGTLYGRPQTGPMSRYFSIDTNSVLAKSILKNMFIMNCIIWSLCCLFFVFHRVALLLEAKFTRTVYTRIYAAIKKGTWHFEMDCKWNFKSQTWNNFFEESNNQNELFYKA